MIDKTKLSDDDWEVQLQQALAEIPLDEPPPALRRKLRRIPRQQRAGERPLWLRPAWIAAFALLPLTVLVVLQQQRLAQQEQQIAQGKRDLVLVLTYVQKANRLASGQVVDAINGGMSKPVAETTIHALQQPLEITREYEL